MSCLCFTQERRPEHVDRYVWFPDGTWWAILRWCPAHDNQPVVVVWAPAIQTDDYHAQEAHAA